MNIVVLIVLTMIYVLLVILTTIKLKDIKSNYKKYEERELIKKTEIIYADKRYSFCRFFKSLSHQYSCVNFLFFMIIASLGIGIILLINRLYAGINEYIFMGTPLIGGLAFFFLSMPIGMGIIPLVIKKPFFVITTLELFNTDYRPKIYFKTYLMFLIFFIIAFPFVILSCNNYAYYTNSGVYTNKYFQVCETYTPYEDVSKVEIYVSHNNNNEITSLNYIIHINNNQSVNINSQNMGRKVFTDSVIDIHYYLVKSNNCEFIVTPLTEDDKAIYKTKVSNEDYENIIKIFAVNETSEREN